MDTLENSDFAKSGIRQTVYAVAFYVFFATRRYRFSRCAFVLQGLDGATSGFVCGLLHRLFVTRDVDEFDVEDEVGVWLDAIS